MKEPVLDTARLAFNLAGLLERVENDHELLQNLLEIFLRDFPHYLRILKEAVTGAEMQQVRAVSHTLKGMLCNLAMDRAAARAGYLEKLGRDGEKAEVEEAFVLFEQEVAGLLPELDKYLREARG